MPLESKRFRLVNLVKRREKERDSGRWAHLVSPADQGVPRRSSGTVFDRDHFRRVEIGFACHGGKDAASTTALTPAPWSRRRAPRPWRSAGSPRLNWTQGALSAPRTLPPLQRRAGALRRFDKVLRDFTSPGSIDS